VKIQAADLKLNAANAKTQLLIIILPWIFQFSRKLKVIQDVVNVMVMVLINNSNKMLSVKWDSNKITQLLEFLEETSQKKD